MMLRLILVAALTAATFPAAGSEPDETFNIQCSPIGTVIPSGRGPAERGPGLAVLDTEIRPGRARLLLDGREIGRASDFDGFPGQLFLEPGRYRLRVELGGYGAAVFKVDARPDCLYRIRYRMGRVEGTRKEKRRDRPDLVRATDPVFLPRSRSTSGTAGVSGGPDLSLRPDLRSTDRSLRFAIEPDAAAVYVNGEFVGVAGELEAMEQPLAVSCCNCLVELVAPGFRPLKRRISLDRGRMMTFRAVLESVEAGQIHPKSP